MMILTYRNGDVPERHPLSAEAEHHTGKVFNIGLLTFRWWSGIITCLDDDLDVPERVRS
jgi:hypothetical protein